MDFFPALEARARAIDSPLCVGLDPRVAVGDPDAERLIVEQNTRIIEATSALCLCYKPNSAFYEQHGPAGLRALKATIEAIPEGIPVLLDAKRGDIGSTAEAYAEAVAYYGVGAVTVNPYMGADAVRPFTDRGLAIFVLCSTSNPGQKDFQTLDVNGTPLYLRVAEATRAWPGEIGLVVGITHPHELQAVRRILPDAWFLAPGVGTQGATMQEAVDAGVREDGFGLLTNVSRHIAGAPDPGRAALDLVEAYRGAVKTRGNAFSRVERRPNVDLLDAILSTGCFRTGSFTLKSGIVSPFYIDLRRLQSDPAALEAAARAYASLLEQVTHEGRPADRLAAVPVASLPIATALALHSRMPLLYPRLPPKPHGTGNRIEGEWKPGERVVLVDDLVTTGLSKLEAAGVLREEGLVVEDLLVLIERGGASPDSLRGREELRDAGIRVYAAATIADLVARAREVNVIDEFDAQAVLAFLEGSP